LWCLNSQPTTQGLYPSLLAKAMFIIQQMPVVEQKLNMAYMLNIAMQK
jgi:hypothetical protein